VAASPEFHDCLLFQFINARGVNIAHLSEFFGEQEVLIAPPSVFKVVAHMHVQGSNGVYNGDAQQWEDGLVMITLEQVHDSPLISMMSGDTGNEPWKYWDEAGTDFQINSPSA
jgi:hypothetical protein